jgi:hypothetical protein
MSAGRMDAHDDFNIQLLPEKADVFLASPCKAANKEAQWEYIKTIFDSFDPKKVLVGPEEDSTLALDEFVIACRDSQGERRQKYKLDIPFVSFEGSHLLWVPPGYYARVRIAAEPFLLQEGRHVFHHQDFQFEGLTKATEAYIQYQAIHVITVPPGQEANMSKGGVQRFQLAARPKPYVFVDSEMQYHGLEQAAGSEEYCDVGESADVAKNNQALFTAPFKVMENYIGTLSTNHSGIFQARKIVEKGWPQDDKKTKVTESPSPQLVQPKKESSAAGVSLMGEASQQASQVKIKF